MALPETAFGVIILIALALPGIVFGTVRRVLRGFSVDDKDLASRLSEAIAVSVLLDAFYLLIFRNWLWSGVIVGGDAPINVHLEDPAGVAIRVLVLAVAIPAVLALLRYAIPWESFTWLDNLIARAGADRILHDGTPSAWDHAAASEAHVYVRIRRVEDKSVYWIGGWYSGLSAIGGFPSEKRDIFLEKQFVLDPEGKFLREADETAGVWVSIQDTDVVQFIKTGSPAGA